MDLKSGPDKVREICKILENETIMPAKETASKIIADANVEADAIRLKAREDAEEIMKKLKKDLEKAQSVADASIELSIKQGVARLRQLVLELFTDEMQVLANSKMKDADMMGKVANALVESVSKDGIEANLGLVLGKNVSKEDLITNLTVAVREKVEKGGITLGNFQAGIIVRFIDKKMAIEITDKSIVELLSKYVHEDLRQKLFRLF